MKMNKRQLRFLLLAAAILAVPLILTAENNAVCLRLLKGIRGEKPERNFQGEILTASSHPELGRINTSAAWSSLEHIAEPAIDFRLSFLIAI